MTTGRYERRKHSPERKPPAEDPPLNSLAAPPSSRGLGRRPLTAETGVRIPVAVPWNPLLSEGEPVAPTQPRGNSGDATRFIVTSQPNLGARFTLCHALLTAAVLFLPCQSTASTPAAGHARYAIDDGVDFSNLPRTAARHGVVILKSGHAEQMRRIKAARPGVKVLVYKNFTFTSSSWTAPAPSGVLFSESQPDWFLRDGAGRTIESSGYGYLTAMDVGHPAYQQRWADNVASEVASEGWDGVFLDDVNPTMKYHTDPGRIAKYPNDAAWSDATRRALAAITPRIRAVGKLAVANIGTWHEHYATGRAWLQHLDGAMQENFVKWGTSPSDGYVWDWPTGGWSTMLEMVRETERQGKLFLGIAHSQNGDAPAARYGWATVLLAGQGRSYFALHGDYANETWFPEYDYRLGTPSAAAAQGPDGVWRRRFEHGLVVVNPTTGARSVELGGTYSGSGLSSATSASLAPTSALILERDGGVSDSPLREVEGGG